jgi:hypothetical protein
LLHIVNLEEIQGMLLLLPSIVDLQENKDPNFVNSAKKWLSDLEKVLYNNKISISGNIASLRSELISAERGVIPEGIKFHGRINNRKIKDAAAANLIKKAGDLVSDTIHKDQERVTEAERITQQLVTLSKTKGIIKEIPHGEYFTEKLKAIWNNISADPDLSAGIVNLTGLIGVNDALIILDRTITRNENIK